MALGKLPPHVCSVTRQYNLVPAKRGGFFGWKSNRSAGGK